MKIGLLVAFALIATTADAASPSITLLRDSTDSLLRRVHVYGGTEYHTACAAGHDWRKRQWADGSWHWVYYSPCVWLWGPRKRRESPN